MVEPWIDCVPLDPAAEFIDANMCAVLVVSRGERDEGSVDGMVTDPFSTRRSKSRRRFRPCRSGPIRLFSAWSGGLEILKSAGDGYGEVMSVFSF